MAKSLYAVIIGINDYPRKPLYGCLNDALAIQEYFKQLCAAQSTDPILWKPLFLLAPSNDRDKERIQSNGIDQNDYAAPTRDNIIGAFKHFEQAQSGDYCLFYYSGHGSTATAPEVFKGYAPGDILQTLVAADSRVDGKPDILDKELGYLIAKALEGKEPGVNGQGVHFLAIIDSCHSGTVTRNDDDNSPVPRMAEQGFAPKTIEGFTTEGNVFYTPFLPGQKTIDPNGGIRHARYLNLSASRNSESAYEIYFDTPDGQRRKRGVFTWSLLETLRQNGTNLSYGELIRRAEMIVRSRVDNQIPILGKTDIADENLLFFRNQVKTPAESYQVVFDARTGTWKMNAGALNGIPDPAGAGQVYVRIGSRPVKVSQVGPGESVLDPTDFSEADKNQLVLSATLDPQYLVKIKIGFSDTLTEGQIAEITKAFDKAAPRYATLVGKEDHPVFLIKTMPDRQTGQPCYVLTRAGSNAPMFMRTPDASQFVTDIAKVTRYEYVLALNNPASEIPRDAIKVTIKTLEGVPFDATTLNQISADKYREVPVQSAAIPYPELVQVSGKAIGNKIQQPAIQVRIQADSGAYWVGALYCNASFGINPGLLNVTQIGPGGEADFADMKFEHRGAQYLSIPLKIDEAWQALGVTEIQDYLILLVSTQKPQHLEQFRQEGVKLETMRDEGFDNDTALAKEDWRVIKIPVKISIPKPKQILTAGKTNHFGAFQIIAPAGFSATCEAVNRASVLQGKDMDEWDAQLPPHNLWDGVEGAPEVFARGISSAPDAHLSMVELTDFAGAVDETSPLLFVPADPLKEEESILPFGYDPESGLSYPLGYTDEAGNVRITRLPEATAGRIGQQEEGQKSLGGSLKLFFQKLVWSKITGRKRYYRLSQVSLDQQGNLQRPAEYFGSAGERDQHARQTICSAVQNGDVLLLVHGIIGDTNDSAPAMLKLATTTQKFKTVLAFDYENLMSPIEESVETLLRFLRDCEVREKSVTIVAHSMGGLVSRRLIEHVPGGATLVNKLVQLGTPNGGSEVADFRQKLFGWIALGLNGVTVLKPYLAFCSLLWKGLEKRLFHTLDEMQPGSSFLSRLNAASDGRQNLPYHLITGNTSLIEASAGEEAPVWKQLLAGLSERGKYILADYTFFKGDDANDLVVRVTSARAVPGGFNTVDELACDHVSYFGNIRSIRALEAVL